MKISVVTAVLNSANTLGNTLQSVLEQTYDDVECLVVDGFAGYLKATADFMML